MDPVIVSPIGTILAVIGTGAGCAALILSEHRAIRSQLRSLSERLAALDRRVSGLDRRLARLEDAFSVAFALPRPPAPGTESPPASVTRPQLR